MSTTAIPNTLSAIRQITNTSEKTTMKTILVGAAFAALSLPAMAAQPVAINFAADVAGAPFSCATTYEGLGSTKAAMNVSDYRLFVSEPALIRADGSLAPITLEQDGQWQYDNVALLDFEDGTAACSSTGNAPTNTVLRGTVEDGEYVGLSFTVGLPFKYNHVDTTVAPAPLNTTGMFWTWQDGFRFMQINLAPAMGAMGSGDAKVENAAAEEKPADDGMGGMDMGIGWFLHLGSTQCAANSQTEIPSAECGNPNLINVVLPSFNPASNTVVIDPAPVVAEADMNVNAPETAPGCMAFPGDADCLTVMPKLGLAYDGNPAGTQVLVTAR